MPLPNTAPPMSTQEALRWLELSPPKIKGSTQSEVDEKLAEWKRDDLKQQYRKMLHKHHPDHNPGDEDANQRVQVVRKAYEKLLKLKVNLKKPVTACPCCHVKREPADANYCHKCGRRYQHDTFDLILMDCGMGAGHIDLLRQKETYQNLRDTSPLDPHFRQMVKMATFRTALF